MSAAFWKGVYHAMLVAAVVLLFTDDWAAGAGIFFGVGLSYLKDFIFTGHKQRLLALKCAEVTFGYQAYLAMLLVDKQTRGEQATEEEKRKQKFWARASIRYLTLARGQHPFRTNKRST